MGWDRCFHIWGNDDYDVFFFLSCEPPAVVSALSLPSRPGRATAQARYFASNRTRPPWVDTSYLVLVRLYGLAFCGRFDRAILCLIFFCHSFRRLVTRYRLLPFRICLFVCYLSTHGLWEIPRMRFLYHTDSWRAYGVYIMARLRGSLLRPGSLGCIFLGQIQSDVHHGFVCIQKRPSPAEHTEY